MAPRAGFFHLIKRAASGNRLIELRAMRSLTLLFALFAFLLAGLGATRTPELTFQKIELDTGANETAAFADINGDGRLDVVSGENWYENPTWKKHNFRDLPFENNYIDNFSDLPLDVDGDGRVDIVGCQWFGKRRLLVEESGTKGRSLGTRPSTPAHNVEFCFARRSRQRRQGHDHPAPIRQ